MEYKGYIKLDNKLFNINKIDFFEFIDEELSVLIVISNQNFKFKFDKEEHYARINSYMKLFYNEFNNCKYINESKPEILSS